jgi:dolichyl-phosphate-mannose-protein mannosyltransferase
MKWPRFRLPERIGWRDHVIGVGLAVAYVVALLATARAIGFMRDESVYFGAGSSYFRWWRTLFEQPAEALRQNVIDGSWSYNHEHPALMKTLFGVSWGLLHERWHVFRYASNAYRFPAMCMAGIALYITYLFGARAWTRSAGFVAAVLLALMPRLFFHAHLACFDVPIMTMWLWCVYLHWRTQERGGLLWAIATGIVYGLTLETKHNAWLLPLVVVPHAVFVQRLAILRGLRAGRLALPASLVSMAVIGPIVLYALWPYLWYDTVARIEWWVDFHVHHNYYSIEFLGKNYRGPPSPKSYVPVMVAATVPTVTIVLFAVGATDRAVAACRRWLGWAPLALGRRSETDRTGPAGQTSAAPGGVEADRTSAAPGGVEADRTEPAVGSSRVNGLAAHPRPVLPFGEREPERRRETDLLLALALIVPLLPFFLEKTPIFGATKHWLPAYPFLALLSGRGFDIASRAVQRALREAPLARFRLARSPLAVDAVLFATVALGPLAITAHSTPFGLSTYVPLVGGTAGGATLGLNRQFWGYTSQDAATEYLNSHAPRNASVFIHDTSYEAWVQMQREDRVRPDLHPVGAPHDSEFALVEHELHMNELDDAIWVVFGNDSPVYVVTHDGVPIVSVYRR